MKKFFLLFIAILFLGACQPLKGRTSFLSFHSDSEITQEISQAFMNHPLLNELPIRIESHEGIVALSGYVHTIRQSDTAGELAAQMKGVKSVQNNLIVRKS